MASISDTRMTILQIVNEVRRKLGIAVVTSLTSDSNSKAAVDYLNDVADEVSDYGDWQEAYATFTVTAQTSVYEYSFTTSSVFKNIDEVAWQDRIAPLRLVGTEDMRRFRRIGSLGQPHSWALLGVGADGNPKFQVYPTPSSSENGDLIDVQGFTKPRQYTTSDGAEYPPYPARLLVQGLLAFMLLDESRGTPESEFKAEYGRFRNMLEEVFNRYNGDTGTDTTFTAGW